MQSIISRALIPLLLCSSFIALAQGKTNDYIVDHEATLSGAAGAVTVQLPAASGTNVKFKTAQVWCSATSVEAWIERDGTAANATTLAVGRVNPSASWVPSSTAAAFSASNVGAASRIGPKQTVYSGTSGLVLDLESFVMERGAASVRNLTIRTGTYTGTVRIAIQWEERSNL